jgi:hypothetical protein
MLFIIIFILGVLVHFTAPWWVIAILVFAATAVWGKTPKRSFWSAFAAIGLLWLAVALMKSIPNQHLLAGKVANMFYLPHWTLLLLLTGLIGGLVAGMSALSGLYVRQLIRK